MNKVFIIGNLTRDPEMRVIPSGQNVCTFSVAVNRRGGQQGQREADFYNVSAWRGLGESCYKYLKKGSKCAVVGNLSLRTYDGKDGLKRSVLDVTADDVEFLTAAAAAAAGGQATDGIDAPPIHDDDLPF